MEQNDLREAIEFAIEKEQEAADWYNDLAGNVKMKAIAEELKKMAAVEEGHRDRLKSMDVNAYTKTEVKPGIDLKIADYMVDKEPTPDMSWQDLLQIAMRRELAAMNLYTDLSKLTPDPATKQFFENLAAEEEGHKLFFEKTWDDEVLTDN